MEATPAHLHVRVHDQRRAEYLGRRLAHLPLSRITHGPQVPDAWGAVLSSFADVSEEEASQDAALGSRAIDLLAGPAMDGRERIEVVITHAFTLGWLVGEQPVRTSDAPSQWWKLLGWW